ncbi:hypothetical protein F5Y18DRAFT_412845 [Xylariaceae sp. FL1019]|nr:hypothetical protein F5Y18DRAFT_412845 [Xylariaceae sp. FL1019]
MRNDELITESSPKCRSRSDLRVRMYAGKVAVLLESRLEKPNTRPRWRAIAFNLVFSIYNLVLSARFMMSISAYTRYGTKDGYDAMKHRAWDYHHRVSTYIHVGMYLVFFQFRALARQP